MLFFESTIHPIFALPYKFNDVYYIHEYTFLQIIYISFFGYNNHNNNNNLNSTKYNIINIIESSKKQKKVCHYMKYIYIYKLYIYI